MLPSKGYFSDIDCPYHERTCGRPYCHFRHRKKLSESEDESSSRPSIPTYKPTPKSELASNKSHIPISYVPDIVRTSGRSSYNIKDRPTYKPTPKSVLQNAAAVAAECTPYTPTPITQLKVNDLNLEELSQEFQLIDEILIDTNTNDSNSSDNKLFKELPSNIERNKPSGDSSDKKNEELTEKGKHRSRVKSESKEKHRNKNDVEKNKDKHENQEQKSKEKHDKSHKSDKDKDRTKRSSSSSTKSSSKTDLSIKSKSDISDKSENKDRHAKDRHKSSSSRSKSKHHDKDKQETKKSSGKSSSRHSDKKHKEKDKSPKLDLSNLHDFDLQNEIMMETDDDLDTMMIEDECLKIFNEYNAQEVPPPTVPKIIEPDPPKPEVYDSYPSGKKRIAYSNAAAAKDEVAPRPVVKQHGSVGLIMQNRIRIARQAHAANEAQNLMAEMKSIKRTLARPTSEPKKAKPNGFPRPTPTATPSAPAASTSLVDDIISGRSLSTKPKRIAPASNVISMQRAKAKIDEIKNRVSASNSGKTIAQTISKGAKRAAHVPDTSLASIPDVLHAERSKLPVNVRTRYLCMIADECVKMYISTDEAYARALNEEFKCYERCSALITYRNSAMLAVNRLRKEAQEREASGIGPLQVGEVHDRKDESLLEGQRFYDQVKPFMLSDEELVIHGFPREASTPGRAVIQNDHKQMTSEHLAPNQRICCRCHKLYLINREGFPLIEEECCYHPLRKRTIRGERTYLCCKSSDETGCAMSNTHVSEISADRELEGYQSTLESEREDDPRNFAVYALDCEMCYTTKGLELTRVTVVDSKLKIIYESLVKPFNPIIDYNTRFSGITEEQMNKTSTNILQIQATMLHLCSAKTILIGHSLESDMKALKIIHNCIIDTSVMFPHKFGLPHKRALRTLASEYLKKIIQNDVGGHDSAEDALAAMELVVWKVKEELKVKGIKH